MSNGLSSILDQIMATQQVSNRDNFKPRVTMDKLLSFLTDRERQILWRRFGLGGNKPETLENIGKSFHITRERVRQIERLAISKLKENSEAQEAIKGLKQVVVEILESEGGAVTNEQLFKMLSEIGEEAPINMIIFFMTEMLTDVAAPLGGDDGLYQPGWRLRTASPSALEKIITTAQEIITNHGVPLAEAELSKQLLAKQLPGLVQGVINDGQVLLNLLQLSAGIKRNAFGEWGLKHWETITPRRMNDKIYLVLKKHGKPMHFRDIVRLINEQGFDHKKAYAPTVHNELILDDKFVLVGRGIYALAEWGFKPGVVADVMLSILHEKGRPMTRDELVTEVLKQRVVKKGTVLLALTDHTKFHKLPDGRYQAAAQTATEPTRPVATII